MDKFPQAEAYVEAQPLQSLFQSAAQEPGQDSYSLQSSFLKAFGLSEESFSEAVEEGGSLRLDLRALPHALDHPLWEQAVELMTVEPESLTRELEADLEQLPPLPLALERADTQVSEQSRAELEKRLLAAGRSQGQAKREAALLSRQAGVLSRVTGAKPDNFLSRISFAQGDPDQLPGGASYQQAAMYRAKSKTVEDFVEEAKATDLTDKQPFFHFDNNYGETLIELGAHQVRHIINRHPDFNEWERIPEVIETGQATSGGFNRGTKEKNFIYTLDTTDSTLVVIAVPNVGGKKKQARTVVLTAFRDNTAGVKTWLEQTQNKNAASSPSARLFHPGHASPQKKEAITSEPQSGTSNISTLETEIKFLKTDTSYKQAKHRPNQEAFEEAEAKLAREVKEWETKTKEIFRVIENKDKEYKKPISRVQMLKQTPLVLQMVSKDETSVRAASEGGIWLSAHFIKQLTTPKAQGGHPEITQEVLAQIPAAMANPIAIFDPSPSSQNYAQNIKNGDLVFIVNVQDSMGATLVLPVVLQASHHQGAEINLVKTGYGKTIKRGKRKELPSDNWFLNQLSKEKTARYVNERLLDEWLGASLASPRFGPYQNVHGHRVYNEEDLVKLKKANPGLYQAENAEGSGSSAGGARGRTDILGQGNYRVIFGPEADVSTALHEAEHIFINEALRILDLPDDQIADKEARDQLAADIQSLAQWAGLKDGAWTVEAHEKVARAFEQYLMEGEAPVSSLRSIFKRMKKWLLAIYKSMRDLGEPLNDEIRRVFDRQLATEEELALESWRSQSALGNEELSFIQETDPELYDEYAATANKASEEQEREISAFRNAAKEKAFKQWLKEGRAQAKEQPDQILLSEIKRSGGISAASLKACGYDNEAILQLQKRHPGLVRNDSKIGLDERAAALGLTADDFFQKLLAMPSIENLAADYAREQEAYFSEYFESTTPLTDAGVDLAELELKIWARYMAAQGSQYKPKSSKDIQRYINRAHKIKNADEIYAKDMADLRAVYKAQIRAARQGYQEGLSQGQSKGYKAGVAEGYSTAKALAKAEELERRLELAMRFRDQAQRQRSRQKAMAEFKRIIKQDTAKQYRYGGILPSYHSQIKALLHNLGLGSEVATAEPLAAFVQREKEANGGLGLAEWIINGQRPEYQSGRRAGGKIPLESLPDPLFQDVVQAVHNLLFLGRRNQQILVDGNLADLNQAVEELVQSAEAKITVKDAPTEREIFEDKGTKKSALKGLWQGFAPALLKIETMCRVLDGGQYGGLWQKRLYEPINRAYHGALSRQQTLLKDMTDLIEETVGRKEMLKWRGTKIVITDKDGQNMEGLPVFTKEELFLYILHQGNSQNATLARNFDFDGSGRGLSEEQHQALLRAAPRPMWDLAQKVWDYQDQVMFPQLDQLTQRTTGLPLKKVEGETVKSPYGDYRGGYCPIVFDRRLSEAAERLHSQKESELAAINRFRPGRTNASATIERQGSTYKGLRASLSFDALVNSWLENIHDLSYREATSDIKRLLSNQKIRSTVSGAFSEQHLRQFDLWLQEQIAPGHDNITLPAAAERALAMIRSNISLAAMGFKASVVLCQFTGILQAMHKIGPVKALAGISHFGGGLIRHGRAFVDELYAKSPELAMRNIKGSFDRDIKDAAGRRSPLSSSLREKLGDAGFKAVTLVDQLMANCIWSGAYLDAISRQAPEAEAIEIANAILRTTQSTGLSKDFSHMQRGWGYGEMGKLFTMFSTFFSASHNLIWEQYQLTKNDLKRGSYSQAAKGAGLSRSAFLASAARAAAQDLSK